MTCKQLGGACDKVFQRESFDEIAQLSKEHGMAMFQQQDKAHLKAMQSIQELMQKPEAMQLWFENKKKAFDELPED